MKQFLIIIALAGAASIGATSSKTNTIKPKAKALVATCIGANPCKACKNCKYCKRCAKDGKTCGVCK